MTVIKLPGRTIRIKGIRFLLLSMAAISLFAGISGCSSGRSHKTLAFFFDGVPAAAGDHSSLPGHDSIRISDSAGIKRNLASAEKNKTLYHQPYKERKCSSCHDQTAMGKFVMPQPMLCYQCHEDFNKKFKVVHGPAGGGYCTGCHEVHTSINQDLVKRVGQQLCLYCHNPEQVFKNEAHRDIANVFCTACHDPHGGKDRRMLK